jgi:hypothetical protein
MRGAFLAEYVACAVLPPYVTDALERHLRDASELPPRAAEHAAHGSPLRSAAEVARARRRAAMEGGRALLSDFDRAGAAVEEAASGEELEVDSGEDVIVITTDHSLPPRSPRAHADAHARADGRGESPKAAAAVSTQPSVAPAFARALHDRYVSANTPPIVSHGLARTLDAARAHGRKDDSDDGSAGDDGSSAAGGEAADGAEEEPGAADHEGENAPPPVAPAIARALRDRYMSANTPAAVVAGLDDALSSARAKLPVDDALSDEARGSSARSVSGRPLVSAVVSQATGDCCLSANTASSVSSALAQLVASSPPKMSARNSSPHAGPSETAGARATVSSSVEGDEATHATNRRSALVLVANPAADDEELARRRKAVIARAEKRKAEVSCAPLRAHPSDP